MDVWVNNDAAHYHHERTWCFAHALQLVLQDGLEQAPSAKVLGKVSPLVSHGNKSGHSSEILESEKRLQTASYQVEVTATYD